MTRAERRRQASAERRFRRRAGDAGLVTALVEVGTDISAHPHGGLFNGAISDALRDPSALSCIVCAEPLSLRRQPAAWLFSCAAVAPRSASVSAICAPCWRSASETDIEQACERVLRRLLPTGHFIDDFGAPACVG